MAQKWIGPAKHLFIPAVVNAPGFLPPPQNFKEFVQQRVHFDPDPVTNLDRSVSSYFADVSYGRAVLDARVSDPVTISASPNGGSLTLAAINAQPNSHLYNYVSVVFPANQINFRGMAQPGQTTFDPPREPNRSKGRTRFLTTETTGTWVMEIMHVVTGIGDYYNGVAHPGGYDVMANNDATTHPSVYTKLEAGWIDQDTVPNHSGALKSYSVHAVALPHPPSAGRVAAVKLQAPGSDRYLLVEARLRSDRWDTGFLATKSVPEARTITYPGIPSEGVVVYEFSPQSDPWERRPDDPNGPWPPLELRTVLDVGETYEHHDTSTPTGTRDHRTGVGRHRTIAVRSRTPGSFVVDISTDAAA